MVKIVGTYEHVSNSPDFAQFLEDQGAPPQLVKVLVDSKPTVTITASDNENAWELKVTNAGKDATTNFKLGEPYDEPMPHGVVLKSVTKREGNKFITSSTAADGKTGLRVYEFNDGGFTVYLSDEKSGKKVSRVYKRI